MTFEKHFRTCVSKKEILDSLISIHIENSDVILWQNVNGIRKIKKARIEAIDFQTSSIILSPQKTATVTNFKEFDSGVTLYFIGEDKNLVFKQTAEIKLLTSDKVQVLIPDEVRLLEKRLEQRLKFDSTSEKTTAKIYTGSRTGLSITPTIIDVCDVSLSGMGFYLPKKNARFFYEKDKVKIERIGHHRFNRPVTGIVVYIIEERKNAQHFRVGVRFVEKLNEEIISDIKSADVT